MAPQNSSPKLVPSFFIGIVVSILALVVSNTNSVPWTGAYERTFQGETYYIVYQPPLNWPEAVSACSDAGLVLTSVETREQREFLGSVSNLQDADLPWIGGARPPAGGNFTWVANGEVVPAFVWNPGQPDNGVNHIEYYMNMWPGGANDLSDEPRAFICTTKTGLVQPTTTTTEQPETPTPTTTSTTEKTTTKSTTTTTTTLATTTTTIKSPPLPTTTVSIPTPAPFICNQLGKFPEPLACTKYHVCALRFGVWVDTLFACDPGLIWCPKIKKCYYQHPVTCPCPSQHL